MHQLGTLVGAACAARTTGVRDDQADIAVEATHDRRHEVPQHVAEYTKGLLTRVALLVRAQFEPEVLSGSAEELPLDRLRNGLYLADPVATEVYMVLSNLRVLSPGESCFAIPLPPPASFAQRELRGALIR